MRTTFTPAWSARLLGALVLAGSVVAGLALAASGGAPAWTWILLALFGAAALVASIANFGDRWHFDDEGITHENVVLTRLGRPPRHARWADVLSGSDHEGRTLFLVVDGQGRWVLDQLDGHAQARALIEAREVRISDVKRPRLWQRGPTDAR